MFEAKEPLKNSLANFSNSLEFSMKALSSINISSSMKNFEIEPSVMNELKEDMEETISSCEFYITKIKGLFCVENGDKLYKEAIYNNEELDMFLIFGALDKYREVMLINQIYHAKTPIDIEIESISSYKIGIVFYKIFKDLVRAKSYIMSAMVIAQDLEKNLMTEKWYIDSMDIISEINNKEELERTKNKEPFLLELKDVLKEIEDNFKKSLEAFLRYIVVSHPPSENFVFNVDEEIKNSNQRKVLVRLIGKYHPDKFPTSDMLKKVKMEEITKLLNTKFEYFK